VAHFKAPSCQLRSFFVPIAMTKQDVFKQKINMQTVQNDMYYVCRLKRRAYVQVSERYSADASKTKFEECRHKRTLNYVSARGAPRVSGGRWVSRVTTQL
jgi:hypothetical protein